MTPGLERPRLALLLLVLGLVGCGDGCAREKQQRFSVPVGHSSQSVTVGEGPVPDPVSAARLAELIPELAPLSPLQQAVVEGVLNTQPAPCPLTLADGTRLPSDTSIASALDKGLVGCENLPVLARRAIRLAGAGASPAAVRATLTYPEPWSGVPMLIGRAQAPQAPATAVELWIDPGFGPWVEAVQRAGELQALGEVDPVVGPVEVTVRVLPTGSSAQDPARVLARVAVAAADQLDQGLPYARCLGQASGVIDEAALAAAASCAGLEVAAWQQLRTEGAEARVQQDIEDARNIGLRAAPSWRVDGYRLRGHRALVGLRDVVENQRIDRLSELPAELLQPWDPGLPPAVPEETVSP